MVKGIKSKINRFCTLILNKIVLNKDQQSTNQNSSNKEIEIEIEYNEFGYPRNLKKNQSNKAK